MVRVGEAVGPSVRLGYGIGGDLAVWHLYSGLAVVQSWSHCTVSRIECSPLHGGCIRVDCCLSLLWQTAARWLPLATMAFSSRTASFFTASSTYSNPLFY